ncbi:MAG: glyoxalase [Acaryochloris sp. RU_4_1]|nr:glyoxalase [Acaryochloris sp. SU_5_25]NJM64469.1 glyoxalase [Acaryochloris sp. RU_4_1]NJR53363.1 glyoxalase [Acaryochloris sp. CRU_2_0]
MRVYGIDHIQLAIPPNSEDLARVFYGEILGLREKPKPEHLVQRGGVWFEQDDLKLHLGVDCNFCPATKAHPGLLVEDLDELVSRCEAGGYRIVVSEGIERYRQVYVIDPFGNRLELLEFMGE